MYYWKALYHTVMQRNIIFMRFCILAYIQTKTIMVRHVHLSILPSVCLSSCSLVKTLNRSVPNLDGWLLRSRKSSIFSMIPKYSSLTWLQVPLFLSLQFSSRLCVLIFCTQQVLSFCEFALKNKYIMHPAHWCASPLISLCKWKRNIKQPCPSFVPMLVLSLSCSWKWFLRTCGQAFSTSFG